MRRHHLIFAPVWGVAPNGRARAAHTFQHERVGHDTRVPGWSHHTGATECPAGHEVLRALVIVRLTVAGKERWH